MKYIVISGLFLGLLAQAAQAQHQHHSGGEMPVNKAPQTDTTLQHVDRSMQAMDMAPHSGMSHSFSSSLPMNRNGSGTAWLPDLAPMYGYMIHRGPWMYMVHGNIFVRYNRQDLTNKGSRGAGQIDVPNMVMFMGQRGLGSKGLLHFNTMFSLDAVFTGGNGYPLLFQTGETWKGRPLVDRQHPHDLFSELSISYSHALNKDLDAFVYLAYPGEPALGPVTFMHRPSGMDNPDAPLSHHWVDATHISFGVATLGLRYKRFKLEGSSFTGREPDEDRYNFDQPRMDSRSVRLSFNPSANWALQVSHAFINSPERLHTGEDVFRTTASATYAYQVGRDIFFNATGLWGMNKPKSLSASNAALLETSLRLQRLLAYGRYEWVQKSSGELFLDEVIFGHDRLYPVQAFTLGMSVDFFKIKSVIRTAVGAQASIYHTDAALNGVYGKHPLAGEVYLRFYPDLVR